MNKGLNKNEMFKFIACFHPSVYNTISNGLYVPFWIALTPENIAQPLILFHITLNNKKVNILRLLNVFSFVILGVKTLMNLLVEAKLNSVKYLKRSTFFRFLLKKREVEINER